MKKKKMTKQQLILFGMPIAGLFVALLAYFVLVSPQKSHAAKLATEIDGTSAQLTVSRQKPAKPISPHAADLFRLTKALPQSSDMPGVLRQLARVARASSVTLASVKPSQIVPVTLGYGALPVDVTVAGKFPNVVDFLQRLRQEVAIGKKGQLHVAGRLFITNNLHFTSPDGRSVSATLSLDAFVFGIASPVPVGPTGASGSTG